MLAALVAGERDPKVLAQLARARMRAKIDRLEQAFDGYFADHHRFLLARMLSRIEALDEDIAAVDAQIEAQLAPFAQAAARLDEIRGIGPVAAAAIVAEIGVDMSRFPTAGHLCSWAKFAPGINSSAGKTKGSAPSGHGNPYLARVLGEAAVGTSKTNTFLAARYRRIARRRGQPRAVVAVGRSILVIVWHVLHDPDARYQDLGADHYTRHVDPSVKKRSHIRQLEALGYKVTLTPAA
jgi:transposase